MTNNTPLTARSTFARRASVAAGLALACAAALPVHAQGQSKQAQFGGKGLPGETIVVRTSQDAWQIRRNSTLQLIRALESKKLPKAEDEKAIRAFDDILTAFDKNPLNITPMEGMDLMQVYYIPNEDNFIAFLKILSLLTTSGWYDALRFADESGRAEIIHNEGFFKRALLVKKDAFVAFMEQQPQEAAAAVAWGVEFASRFRSADDYDRRWPASYGLMRMQCGMEGKTKCLTPEALPEREWPQAFDEAAARVTRYYRINKD
jgi:hypothetical protein